MSLWPDDLQIGPVGPWPGEPTPVALRVLSPFRANLTSTLKVLDREIYHLAETRAHQQSAELLVAIAPGGFRKDGRPRADARAEHSGVVFSMDTKHGRLSYPADRFTTWEDNLRAIVLSLEALRKIDRYGVTTARGEQYRGFLAIEASGTTGVDAAIALIDRVSSSEPDATMSSGELAARVRAAKRYTHPDVVGDNREARLNTWHQVVEAERILREAGRL